MRARPLISRLVGLLCLSLIAAVSVAPAQGKQPNQAAGTVIRVNTTKDDTDANGNCTLREAVLAANRNARVDACPAGSGLDTIQVPGGYYSLTILGPGENDGLTGDLDISESVNIQGAGISVTGLYAGLDFIDRFFQIHTTSAVVQVSDLRMSGGTIQLAGASSPDLGGGAIHNRGVLRLTRVVFFQNKVEVTDAPAIPGGAIFNAGTLEATNSRFEMNTAAEAGGAIYNQGEMRLVGVQFYRNQGGAIENAASGRAAIENSSFQENGQAIPDTYGPLVGVIRQFGQMEIRDTVFTKNKGREVGAISNSGSLLIEDSTISDNDSDEGPAGIEQRAGTLIIRRSWVIDNSGGFDGGGLVIDGAESVLVEESLFSGNSNYHGGGIRHRSGPTTIVNTTIANNGAYTGGGMEINGEGVRIINSLIYGNDAGEEGGGILSRGSFTIENSTVTENTSYEAGGLFILSGNATILNSTITRNRRGGIRTGYSIFTGTVRVQSSIIAENYDVDQEPTLRDCLTETGQITSLGWNLVGTTGGCNWIPATGDLLGSDSQPIDPRLDPLRDNGGPTDTHALQPGSPALDAAGTQACPDTDQRGIPRPQGAACDIGAFEREAPEPILENQIYIPMIRR